ncbi:MAG: integrin alpha, partial [Thermoplasmatales archaeon]|nr:integrin alpha [Thermoplasmatales archaeon]
ITWNATKINSSRLCSTPINISYSYDGGAWTPIAIGEQNDGYYNNWTVPDINSDNVLINITCNTTDNKEGYDISDNSFTIRSSTPFRELVSGNGNATGDRFGWNVSYAGDLNGDGYDDIAVGAPYVTYNSVTGCGAVYIFFGYSNISLGNLTATYANVSIYGTIADGHFGWSVSDAGDVNGTYDDVIIGAPDTTNGNAYIFCGWTLTNDPDGILTADDADVNISGGSSGDKFGFSVSGAGDVNNDTYDDVIIGAYANGTDKGKAYIFYGASTGPSQINYTACTENYNITGTTTNFPYMRNWADSEANATLSEAAVANDLATIFSERFPVAAAPWTGTGQDQSWNVVTVSEAADIAIKSGEATGSAVSGDPVLWMEDCDDAWGVGDIVWASVDLSGYSSVVIEYYWQLYLVDAGEGFRSAYSTDATGGTDALGTWNLMYEHLDAPESVWTKDTFNLPDSACVANFKFRFNAYATGPGEETYIDDVKITGVPVGLTNRTEIQVNTTSIPSGKNTYTLEIYGNRSDEKFNISVYNGTNWNVRGNISSATMTLFT